MDPLVLLKDFTVQGKPVSLAGDSFIFGDLSFPRNVNTWWKSVKGNTYSLDAIYFALKHEDINFTEYLTQCDKNLFPKISYLDRKPLMSYLHGQSDVTAPGIGTFGPEKISRPADEVDSVASKRAKASETETDMSADVTAFIPGLTAEKLAALKKRREEQKSKSQLSTGGGPAESTSSALVGRENIFDEAEILATKEILAKERLLRTRQSVMHSNKNFSNVLSAVQALIKKEYQEARKNEAIKRMNASTKNAQSSSNNWGGKLADNDLNDFGIDVSGTLTADGPKKPVSKPVPSAPAPSSSASRSSASSSSSSRSSSSSKELIPIIVVPASLTSHLNMLNAKQFFEDGVYIDPRTLQEQGVVKESSMYIKRVRNKNSNPVAYYITDNTTKFTPREWKRVVAVFTAGAAWQFKTYPWPTPTEVFANVMGCYLKYDDENIPETVRQWSVKLVTVSRLKRHLDQAASLHFWGTLDDYISRVPQLRALNTH